ncbi:alcohol dehydrogenase catalytic domain-containing protein [Tsukamurella sp. NPDC003166]|uniref:zinc-binding dehydrogenase n=1 Tax=Tsukamurella sp. NPDC003166 TaxID=3154444 RepID=UPI0033AA7E0A
MRAAVYTESGAIELGQRPDAALQLPTDAVVRVVLSCVCGSDLTYYRGKRPHAVGSIGHEAIGVVEDTGAEVTSVRPGDLVVVPLQFHCGECAHCLGGTPFACVRGATFGNGTNDGGQGEAMRVPFADRSLHAVPGTGHDDALLKSLLTLSDVLCTGHHAAVCAGVRPGHTVAVVGDGAVGLLGVLSAKRLGAERIIALSSSPVRQALATEFGATDLVAERGDEATERVLEMTGGVGVDATLECVGTAQAVDTAFRIARPGSMVGLVGISDDLDPPVREAFWRNVGWRGGPCQVPVYLPELLPDVLDGTIDPGRVFTWESDLGGVVAGYRAMAEQKQVKSLLRVSPL